MQKSSRLVGVFLAMLGMGIMALISSLSKPRVEALRGTDILGLIGSGMCFGVAWVALIASFKRRKE